SLAVNVRARTEHVQHGRQYRLPVVAKRDPLLVQRVLLTGSVEGHPVITALTRCGAAVSPHARGHAVAAVVDDDQRSRLPWRGIWSAKEIADQERLLVGDRQSL